MSEHDYAQLLIDGQSLLLPRVDVRHIELVDKLQSPGPVEGRGDMLATLEYDQRQWPVYTLDSGLHTLQELPATRRFVACLSAAGQAAALACESVSRFQLQGEYLHEALPVMMKTGHSPVQLLLYNEGQLHYITSAPSLVAYLLKEGG